MARVRYVGPHAEGVIVPDANLRDDDGQHQVIKPGDVVDVPDDVAFGSDGEVETTIDTQFGPQTVRVNATSGLLKLGLDENGDGTPVWELEGKPAKATSEAKTPEE